MPRFAILEHDYPTLHWDFFLEAGTVLRAWRLLAKPVPDSKIVAEAAADHRLYYLDYEGPVAGDRGTVRRFAVGSFYWEIDTPKQVCVRLAGDCSGTAELWCEDSRWFFRWTA